MWGRMLIHAVKHFIEVTAAAVAYSSVQSIYTVYQMYVLV